MLTDTTFWFDLLDEQRRRERGAAHRFIAAYRAHSLEVSIITWGELAPVFERPQGLEQVLRGVQLLMLPKQIAWEASRIERELARLGARLGENDNWIAATARAWGLRLVNRDRAFLRVPRLSVIGY